MFRKMCCAIFFLINGKNHFNHYRISSHTYEYLKSNYDNGWLGRKHTDKSRAKTRATMIKNGIKGKRTWMHKDDTVKYVRNELLDEYIKNGFSYGRPGYKPRSGMQGKKI